jgi:hypothetical protein
MKFLLRSRSRCSTEAGGEPLHRLAVIDMAWCHPQRQAFACVMDAKKECEREPHNGTRARGMSLTKRWEPVRAICV